MTTGLNTRAKTFVYRFTSAITACLILVMLTTCGKDSPTQPSPPPVQLVPTSIAITPTATTLTSIGQTVRLTAMVRDQNGQPMPGANVTWSSGSGSVATVNAQGLVTAVGNGSATIMARSGSISNSIIITVKDPSQDRAALISLYHATDGPNWTNSTNWLSDEPLGVWYGVDTDDQRSIFALDLSNNSLSGTIPSELGSLSQLDTLNLVNNQLSGEIPVELGRLSNLKALGLGENRLSGTIPSELGSLSNLWGLGLGNNQLSGEIPVELGNLSNLAALGLNNNQLSDEIPVELGSLSQLQALALDNNQLSGEIPVELGSLSNLVVLSLDNNQLSGEIPVELGGLSNLVFLSFSGNELTGCIPEELRSVPFQDFDDLGLPYCDEPGAEPSALNSN